MSTQSARPLGANTAGDQEPLAHQHDTARAEASQLALRLGVWAGALIAVAGAIYLLALVVNGITGMAYPPSPALQTVIGVSVFMLAPAWVVLMACLYEMTPPDRQVLSRLGFWVSVVFAALVSINRFVALTVLHVPTASAGSEGLGAFDLYNLHSPALALEMLGWGFCLGFASLLAAAVIVGTGVARWSCGLFMAGGFLSLLAGVVYLLSSQGGGVGASLGLLGMACGALAWALILPLASALLSVYFFRISRLADA